MNVDIRTGCGPRLVDGAQTDPPARQWRRERVQDPSQDGIRRLLGVDAVDVRHDVVVVGGGGGASRLCRGRRRRVEVQGQSVLCRLRQEGLRLVCQVCSPATTIGML